MLRVMKAPCVKGDRDEYCAKDLPLNSSNSVIIKAVQWTLSQLTGEDRAWLRNLAHVHRVEDFTTVQARLESPKRWHYAFDTTPDAASFTHQNTGVCFFGHTHVPIAFVCDNVVGGRFCVKFKVELDKKYFVNPGAVGQPRDNDSQAAYVVYYLEEGAIELRRLAYDLETTRKKIREAGFGDQRARAES
jgi:diadenosine tetraphosphatase ApaH/serine/threonine PP2A family protein phosphatase